MLDSLRLLESAPTKRLPLEGRLDRLSSEVQQKKSKDNMADPV